jgi:hypothetical protein
MRRAEHHHVLSQSYLSRFADRNGTLSMLYKQTGKWSTTHVPNAAVRVGFYSVETIDLTQTLGGFRAQTEAVTARSAQLSLDPPIPAAGSRWTSPARA